jgi:hypothetical protein
LIFQADVNLLLNVVNGWVYIEIILKKQKNIQPKTTKNSSPKMKNREKKKKKKKKKRMLEMRRTREGREQLKSQGLIPC